MVLDRGSSEQQAVQYAMIRRIWLRLRKAGGNCGPRTNFLPDDPRFRKPLLYPWRLKFLFQAYPTFATNEWGVPRELLDIMQTWWGVAGGVDLWQASMHSNQAKCDTRSFRPYGLDADDDAR